MREEACCADENITPVVEAMAVVFDFELPDPFMPIKLRMYNLVRCLDVAIELVFLDSTHEVVMNLLPTSIES